MSFIKLKSLYIFIICFILTINISKCLSVIEEGDLSINETYNHYFENIEKEQYIFLSIKDSDISYLNTNYLHFSTYPIDNNKNYKMQQIIYSKDNQYPSTDSSEQYSFRFSKNANLFTILSEQTQKIYLTIKCNEYPCSFNFKASIEEKNANLYLEEDNNFYWYCSNSTSNEKFNTISFKFPSGRINDDNYQMTITVINLKDLDGDYIEIKGTRNQQSSFLNIPKYKINIGTIFTFNEIDAEEDINGTYTIDITSMESQFITLIIKSSKIENDDYLSEITPNSIAKYSYLIAKKLNNSECYKINEEYINNYLNDNDLLYASIDYFTKPINTYFKYSNTIKKIENNENKQSINAIISKENNEYPQICFSPEELNSENSFMIQIHHVIQNSKIIDIYNPIISGYINTKTLPSNSLALFTHNSDVHLIKKLMFYLKPIKGNPKMYNVPCVDYPNCYNTISDLKNNPEVLEASDYGDIQFREMQLSNNEKGMDLSPYGKFQDLLYVYCPEQDNNEICQFEILIFSELDEIILNENEPFYGITTELNDEFLFKFNHKKGGNNYDYFDICINVTNDDIYFDTKEGINNNMNITEIIQDNNKCYRYQPDKRYYNNKKKDTEIAFNIKANNYVNYKLTNKGGKVEHEIGNIYDINYLTFPFEFNIKIDKNKIKSDLLFNLYLNDLNEQSVNFENVEIGLVILDKDNLEKIEDKAVLDIFDNNSLKGKLDMGTRTAILNINKEYIDNNIKDTNKDYYIHILIYKKDNKNNNDDIGQYINSKIFIIERATNNEYFIDSNTFITDKLILEKENIFNYYNLKSDNKDIIELKISSNYDFNDNYLIAFKKYDKNANINFDYFLKDILKYTKTQIGQMYTFEINNNKDKSDIIFAVLSKIKKKENEIQNINYIFKYNTYTNSEYKKRTKYEINETYSLTDGAIEFNSIKIVGKKNYPNSDIHIRKINKKIENENIDTYSIIESDYEYIKGFKFEENGIIKITDSAITTNNEYSIIIDLYDKNEKFFISNTSNIGPQDTDTDIDIDTDTDTNTDKNTDKNTDTDRENEKNENNNDGLWWKILIPSLGVVIIVCIIIIVVCVKRNKGELKQTIMKTSFQENNGLLGENAINDENEL